jgi:probable endonuclease 4
LLLIGCHVSFDKDKQLVKSTEEAISYGANTFMFYTGAPQNTNRSKIVQEKTEAAHQLMQEHHIDPNKVIVHAPYIINLANRDNLDFGIRFLTEELNRCSQLGISYLVLHPGSHVGQGVEQGLQNIIDGLNTVFLNDHSQVKILLESMAGKGSELGKNFQELKTILDGVKDNERLGVCLDTCHLNDAGYKMDEFDQVLAEFDQIIGIDKIGCIHINDSKNPIGAHKDRHENIGFGTIPFEHLLHIIYHPQLENIPKILETPYVDREFPPYREEIVMIKERKFDPELLDKIRKINQKEDT